MNLAKWDRLPYTILVFLVLLPLMGFAQCQFSITRNNNDDHCLYAEEEVVWSNATGVTITGNSIKKNNGTSSSWDAGALSINKVKNNGWATTVIEEITTDRVFGLSSSPSATPSFSRSQYGLYFWTNGKFSIYESGNSRGNPLGEYFDNTYRIGDVFKIWVDKGVVKYYQNNTLLLISSANPTLPLIVDATLGSWSPAATISQVKVSNGSDGTFLASEPNPGTGALFQWYVDNNFVASGASYTNTSLTPANVLTCVMTTGSTGCAASGTLVNSNAIRFRTVSATNFGDYHVLNSAAAFACFGATEPAVFKDINNVEATVNDLMRVRGTSSWNAGAFSVNGVINNGYAQAKITETSTSRFFGLSSSNSGDGFGSVQFAFFIRNDVQLEIYESASLKVGLGLYNTGDLLKIEVDNGVVKYYVNNVLKYISSVVPAATLYADIVFESVNSTLDDVVIFNGTQGLFSTRSVPAGSNPSYQWKWNGAPVPGATLSSYTNTSMANGDFVTCEIHPGLIGCNTITTSRVDITSIPFKGTSYITASPVPIACTETFEQVEFTDKVNVVTTGNTISKFQGGSGFWNAGATSLNEVLNNGYAEVTIAETNSSKVFGLSSVSSAVTHSSSSENTILYGIYFRSDAQADIYELVGAAYTFRGNFGFSGGFSPGDVFRIQIDQGVVRYSRNGTVFYSSPMSPTSFLPMVVDLSLNTTNASLSNLVISNGSSGVFKAVTSNAGASPTYKWKLNGNDDGTNSSVYSNNALIANDMVRCYVIPDIPGCGSTGYLSNMITVNITGGTVSTTWTGGVSSAWDLSSNWSNGVPKGYHKVVIPSGTPNNPQVNLASAGVYDLTINAGASLFFSGGNSLSVFDNFTNQGSLNSGTSTVNFNTCTNNRNKIISSSSESFNNLTIDNVNGVDVTGEHHIKGQMNLTAGIVDYTSAADLIVFDDNATVMGASNASYISGKVKKIGNDAFVFPIGKGGVYRKLSISAPVIFTDHFTVEYFTGNATLLPAYGTPMDPAFWTVSGCEYWTMLRSGASNVTVELSWNLATNCPNPPYITDPNDLRVAYWNGSLWANAGSGGTTGDSNNGTVVSASAIADYNRAFTLASLTKDNPLPIEVLDFDAQIVSSGVKLLWTTLTETNSSHFIIQRSEIGLNFIDIDSVTAAGQSNIKLEYEYIDRRPVSKRSYYRLKLVDSDGSYKFSTLAVANSSQETLFSIYPNPVKRGDKVCFSNRSAEAVIIDPLNKKIMRVLNDDEFIDTTNLPAGLYLYCESPGHFRRFIVY